MTPAGESTTAQSAATRLVVVSGMSGSGKTIALRTLEDLDYYCVDNLPSALMPAFVDAVTQAQPGLHPRLAVGIDVRNRAEDLHRLPEILAGLARRGIEHRLIFLDARDDVLFKRYSDTRRRHPLTGEGLSLSDAIARERSLLEPVSVDRRTRNSHQRPQRAPVAPVDRHRTGNGRRPAVAAVRIVCLQARRAARRRLRVRRALPAESALGCAPAAAVRQGRVGA
jgi:hypothetical protein